MKPPLTYHDLLESTRECTPVEDEYRPYRVKYASVFHALQELKSIIHAHLPAMIPAVDDLRRQAQKIVDEELKQSKV